MFGVMEDIDPYLPKRQLTPLLKRQSRRSSHLPVALETVFLSVSRDSIHSPPPPKAPPLSSAAPMFPGMSQQRRRILRRFEAAHVTFVFDSDLSRTASREKSSVIFAEGYLVLMLVRALCSRIRNVGRHHVSLVTPVLRDSFFFTKITFKKRQALS